MHAASAPDWSHRAALLALAPLLLLQGAHARRRTPRLPEPGGARHGRAGSGPTLLVAAVRRPERLRPLPAGRRPRAPG